MLTNRTLAPHIMGSSRPHMQRRPLGSRVPNHLFIQLQCHAHAPCPLAVPPTSVRRPLGKTNRTYLGSVATGPKIHLSSPPFLPVIHVVPSRTKSKIDELRTQNKIQALETPSLWWYHQPCIVSLHNAFNVLLFQRCAAYKK